MMKPNTHQVCILLGSNIEPEINIPKAVELLGKQLPVLQASSVWKSSSVDCCYPDYLNMALLVSTSLEEVGLKEQVLRPLEARMGRVRTEDKNAARTIDLDIIIIDGAVTDPTLWQHAHRAVPVSEIYPQIRSNSGEPLRQVAHRLAQSTPVQLRKDISILLPSFS